MTHQELDALLDGAAGATLTLRGAGRAGGGPLHPARAAVAGRVAGGAAPADAGRLRAPGLRPEDHDLFVSRCSRSPTPRRWRSVRSGDKARTGPAAMSGPYLCKASQKA